jgi:carboxyl-terminal processing protease
MHPAGPAPLPDDPNAPDLTGPGPWMARPDPDLAATAADGAAGADAAPTPEDGPPSLASGLAAPADPAVGVDPGAARGGYEVPVAPVGRGNDGGPRRLDRVRPIHLALAVVTLLAGTALFISGYSLGARTATTPGTPVGQQQLWAPFWDTYHSISERYAGGPVDQQKLVEGAIKGMVDSLGDPYSSYYGPDAYKQTLQSISGQFEGIGAEIGTMSASGTSGACTTLGPGCDLVVVAPIDGSPAQRAGLRPGDIIERIDGTSVAGLTVDGSVSRIRGPKGTAVTLAIVRDGGAPFDVSIVRDVIVQSEVTTKTLAGGTVGYLRISGFSDNAASQVVDALQADVRGGEKKLIVDLRGNPGGFITAARKVASQFIASGPIYWTEDAQGNQVATDAEGGGAATDPSIRVVVLIDKGSASASEIVAGALQDTNRATLVGETSFGKGTVQQWQPLENDAGGFKLTIAKWLTPAKRWVNHVGLTPDVAVSVPTTTPPTQDPVLDRALQLLGAQAAVDSGG